MCSQTWCSSGKDCTPAVDRYAEHVNSLLSDSPRDTKGTLAPACVGDSPSLLTSCLRAAVLVTTDEQDDLEFLTSVDKLGWYRIDHRRLNTRGVLEAEYTDAAAWADAAVDQAILSLGMHFVGTSGSQVSIISELRVASWNVGDTRMVQRPG